MYYLVHHGSYMMHAVYNRKWVRKYHWNLNVLFGAMNVLLEFEGEKIPQEGGVELCWSF